MCTLVSRSVLADDALRFLNYPSIRYKNPEVGQDPNGFDCSGFLRFLLRLRDFPLDGLRHANEFFDKLGVAIHFEAVDRGDLVFWSWDGIMPRHIGIMVSPTQYIHSPGKDGTCVKIENLERESIERKNDRQIYLSNPIGFKRLAIRNGRYHQVL